jgi:hypothetical protein
MSDLPGRRVSLSGLGGNRAPLPFRGGEFHAGEVRVNGIVASTHAGSEETFRATTFYAYCTYSCSDRHFMTHNRRPGKGRTFAERRPAGIVRLTLRGRHGAEGQPCRWCWTPVLVPISGSVRPGCSTGGG